MQHTDFTMCSRVAEEIFRTGYSDTEMTKILGCSGGTVSHWVSGDSVPNAYYLAKLHRAGCDVIYILTGERTRNDQTGIKNNR